MRPENIFIQVPSYVFWKDIKSHFLGGNGWFATMAGLTNSDEIKGKTDYDFPWGESHADHYREKDQEVLETGNTLIVKEAIVDSQGIVSNILTTKKILIDSKGQKSGVIGSFMEILPRRYGKFEPNKINISLSKNQSECLFLLTQGMSYKQIASRMEKSHRTIRYYIDCLKLKLKCESKSTLIKKAFTLPFIKFRYLDLEP